jgi:hypothetical protein
MIVLCYLAEQKKMLACYMNRLEQKDRVRYESRSNGARKYVSTCLPSVNSCRAVP